jgi:hypothetical protein
MKRIARLAALALALGSASSALGACQAIAGIEDRSYVPAEGPNTQVASKECQDYCTQADKVCGGTLYRTPDTCLATCALWPLKGLDTNSVACRAKELARAVQTNEELERYCANAGPGGNDTCGSNCENYCQLFSKACKDEFQKYADIADTGDDGTAVCVAKCQGLVDTRLYDSTDQGNYLGDTLQCRIVHTTSSTVDPVGHCAHSDLKSNKCFDDEASEPDCEAFCQLQMTECTDYPMYEDKAQCLAVCQALVPGHPGDVADNTVACRLYHSYNSIIDPRSHCPHTGPGGDGHCSTDHEPGNTGNCESYCTLLETACSAQLDADFDQASCQASCAELEGAVRDSGYSLDAVGNNLQCRLRYVSRALTNPKDNAAECSAALGIDRPCK